MKKVIPTCCADISLANFSFAILLSSVLFGCNSTDTERFTEQTARYIFSSTTSTLTAHGASLSENQQTSAFRCPSISGLSTESNLSVYYLQANSQTPHFTLDSTFGVRSDTSGAIGISIKDLPVGVLDLYKRCNSTSYEKLMTACPEGYDIVESCDTADANSKACEKIIEGSHRLIVSAEMNSSKECYSEEMDRSPYPSAASALSYACDAFSPIEVPAAMRGASPSSGCCSIDSASTFDFCVKPCGCRTLKIEIALKESTFDNIVSEDEGAVEAFDDTVRFAVFSNVEGSSSAFDDLLESINAHTFSEETGYSDVDLVVSLGNMTSDGSSSEFQEFKKKIEDAFNFVDGNTSFFGIANDLCKQKDDQICCEVSETSDDKTSGSETDIGRIIPSLCNTVIYKKAFAAGLGEAEYEGAVKTYNDLFGPSNMSTIVGKVQFIMMDTADASANSQEEKWLKDVMQNYNDEEECNIPAPKTGDKWPLLAECRDILGVSASDSITCRECIQQEAYCIPPDKSRENTKLGPENCICVPYESKICHGNLSCEAMDGTDHKCICTRDEDCGVGGTCDNGTCRPPMRIVFSYTPIMESSGLRNNAFSSKKDAASMMSLLGSHGVSAIFSGRVHDYASYSIGGIPMYITGGGGAPMVSFASKGRHWLLVEIPGGYTHPSVENMKVKVIDF